MELDQIGSMLWKIGLFLVVQALVYLILSQSSNIFSKAPRSHAFRPVRSLSIQRWAAALGDIPAASAGPGDSPKWAFSSFFFRSLSRNRDHHHPPS